MTRRADAPDTTTWQGEVPAPGEIDEIRTWVVWGTGAVGDRAAEERQLPGEPGNDIAWKRAETSDPEWASRDDSLRWVRVLEADEDVVDEWVIDDEAVRGYAAYLVEPENAASRPELMRGVLRPDAVRRRKPKRFDAATPD